ncbi:MAG: nuclear transport factor 2 family protein [Gemmatimonadota bacterium]|nr:nuclear transport factor 2 family protein [Gemmatimonadota bacterium]
MPTVSPNVSSAMFFARAGVAVLLLAACGTRATGAPAADNSVSQQTAEAELRKDTQALLDAIAPGDTAVWNRLLDPNIIIVDENDAVHDKTGMLALLKPLAPGLTGHLAIDDFVVKLHGNFAVVTHEDNEYLDYHGQILRSRFRNTETWIRKDNAWRQTSSMILAVLKDPPAVTLDHVTLCGYSGRYAMTDSIVATIACSGDSLMVKREGRPDRAFRPELRDVFFEPGQPRTRRIFQRDAAGHIIGFVDRREARDLTWKRTGAATS